MKATPSPSTISDRLIQAQLDQVQDWRIDFDQLLQCMEARFLRSDLRGSLRAYLAGLLAPLQRKNGLQLAEHAGSQTPYAVQHLLGRARWDVEVGRDDLRGIASKLWTDSY